MDIKRLRGLVHNVAHHAISGMCDIHPHLGVICMNKSLSLIGINLMAAGYEPKLESEPKELKLSTSALREKFIEIINSETTPVSEIKSASAMFQYSKSDYPVACCVQLITKNGQRLEAAVDSRGKSAEVLRGNY